MMCTLCKVEHPEDITVQNFIDAHTDELDHKREEMHTNVSEVANNILVTSKIMNMTGWSEEHTEKLVLAMSVMTNKPYTEVGYTLLLKGIDR